MQRSYFNPRPREEGDSSLSALSATTCDFNPRPREEGDFTSTATGTDKKRISIHALVKRATLPKGFSDLFGYHFNPRPREEGDEEVLVCTVSQKDFNPRPREEGDTSVLKVRLTITDFNPRPREEGD